MGKCSPSLRKKTLYNVERCNLSMTDKTCIKTAFEKLERFEKSMEEVEVIRDHEREANAESICRSCVHFYVCERFNEGRDSDNKRCLLSNNNFLPLSILMRERKW